ncbi:Ferredoxin subunit of nitrite reductase and ring-hydroxylating dioxygenase [Sandaracinus amylolyticus]|uniref:Ferredoxin subunit of nitrite reductase and ring-hydroxylating dioxygenase n=1 Tax=Sandaracinus amylolyticus TaxID=927083 RepID=A0A0F6SFA2_9BACT|nr:Ferredoxin subunit of nitrite reductase and ring-hydroxylating dioxygenase [Sandaracinus amylolyticus]
MSVSDPLRVRVGPRSSLAPERALTARISNDHDGTPREVIVVLDDSGALRAYVNRCKHLPIPIDGGSRRFFDDEGRHLMCGTHGALFRRADGYCIEGPCRGRSLDRVEIEVDESGTIWALG